MSIRIHSKSGNKRTKRMEKLSHGYTSNLELMMTSLQCITQPLYRSLIKHT